MGFRIHCDACGRFIKTLGIREIRDMDYVSGEPTHCNECQRAFNDLAKKIEKLQRRYTIKLEQLAERAKTDMASLIAEIMPMKGKENASEEVS